MFNWFRQQVLYVMRVPHDPEPPYGAPGSTQVFRAGRNYFKLRLFNWGVTQITVLAGLIFWTVLLIEVEETARVQKQTRGTLPALTPESFAQGVTHGTPISPTVTPAKKPWNKVRIQGWDGFKQSLVELALRLPDWAFPLIWIFKLSSYALFLAQLPFTYALRRLDYELRWYIVTDRSLRIRTGLVRLQESTMSFANLQQVEVKQDPLQRLLGLADIQVQSAGGGSGGQDHGKTDRHDSLHTGIFHSVDNASEIRDLILERLRLFRQAGLGDPDDHHDHTGAIGVTSPSDSAHTQIDALAAARAVLAEARALRATLAS